MKHKFTITIIGAISCALPLFCSCTKTETPSPNINALPSQALLNYLSITGKHLDGSVWTQINLTNNDSTLKNGFTCLGFFVDKNGYADSSGGASVIFGNNSLHYSSSSELVDNADISQTVIYGTNVSYTIHPTVNQIARGAEPEVSGSLYSPAAIYFRNVPLFTYDTIVDNQPMNITWNADAQNKNGVFIRADYDPVRFFNRAAGATGYQTEITAAVHVPDNGSTTLPASFFSKFPPVGIIEVTIGRGNAKIVSNRSFQYELLFVSDASIYLTH